MRLFIKHKFVGFVIISCVVALCLSVPAYLIFQNTKGLITVDLGNNAIDIAATVATFVAKDIEKFNSIPIDDYVNFETDDTKGDDSAPNAGVTGDTEADAEKNGTDDSGSGLANSAAMMPDEHSDKANGLWLSSDDATDENGSGDLNANYFINLKELLEMLEIQTGADRIYIEKKLSSSEKVYLFGNDFSMNRDLSDHDLSEEEHRAFNDGTATQSGVLLGDASDEFIAGYAPIMDRTTQKTVAIVAVEFSVDYAEKIISGIRNIILSCFIIIFLLTSAVVYKLVESRLKYIKKDYLTELCNKRYFEKDLAMSVKSAKRSKRSLSLMMLDVDHFKTINDKLGHVCGDDVLRTISEMLMKSTRSSDVCCRYGGDEFVITMPDTDSAQASMIAERIRNEVSQIAYTLPDNEKLTVTLSIGVSELKDNMTPENLVKSADDALYKSKNSGKNCTLIKL